MDVIHHTVKLRVVPQDDPAFNAVVGRVTDHLHDDEVLDTRAAAAAVEAELRAAGYRHATVDYERTVDEVFQHVAHWTIHRDGGG